MTAGNIVAIVWGVGFLIAWRVTFRTLLASQLSTSTDDFVGCGIMSFFIALIWPVPALLSDWRRWRFRS